MALKRKRSDSAISPLSSSPNQSSRADSSSPCPDVSMHETSHWGSGGQWPRSSSSDVDLRTRKRFRDNRPDDETVHANTYQMLFAAARSPPAVTEASAPSLSRTRPAPPQRQPSLHNYWNICDPPPSQVPQEDNPELSAPPQCEDCERQLPCSGDTNMGGMDRDDFSVDNFQCRNCKRKVCDMCAVVETGIGRDCLQCRTSRGTWIGGLGWFR